MNTCVYTHKGIVSSYPRSLSHFDTLSLYIPLSLFHVRSLFHFVPLYCLTHALSLSHFCTLSLYLPLTLFRVLSLFHFLPLSAPPHARTSQSDINTGYTPERERESERDFHSLTYTHTHTHTRAHDTRGAAWVQVLCKEGGMPLIMCVRDNGWSCLDDSGMPELGCSEQAAVAAVADAHNQRHAALLAQHLHPCGPARVMCVRVCVCVCVSQ